VTESRGRLQR